MNIYTAIQGYSILATRLRPKEIQILNFRCTNGIYVLIFDFLCEKIHFFSNQKFWHTVIQFRQVYMFWW